MTLPNKLNIEINTKQQDTNKLYQVIIINGDIHTKASASNLKKALLNAIDFFELEYTKSLIT